MKKSGKKKTRRRSPKIEVAEAVQPQAKPDKARSLIDQALATLKEKHGENIRRFSASETRGAVSEVIPTGIAPIDHYLIGIGGLPVGRASEVYGPNGVAKTSFMLLCCRAVQAIGGIVILAENEAALDPNWAHNVHGVDLDNIINIETDYIEQTTEALADTIVAMPKSVGPILCAWDSIAATPTKAEVNGIAYAYDEKVKDRLGDRARTLSQACRQLAGVLKGHRVHLMFVNQVRQKIGIVYGSNEVTPGGEAVKFYSSLRFRLSNEGAVKDGSDQIGSDIKFSAVKNKLSPPWRTVSARLDYKTGWDADWSMLAYAMDKKILPARSRGKAALREAFEKTGWKQTNNEEVPL